ncbi:hypothetical protein N7475_006044 [Penicillium sp. IBT 31633x]|nr:hypothetical protein N7475_006044 [Penicillium sp. IBT 31633x]
MTSEDEETGSQRALRRDWPSDDGMYPNTPTPVEVKIPRPLEDRISSHVDLHGQRNMNLADRIQLWSHHGN